MSTLQVLGPTELRSPSPVIPGAWPSPDPVRDRSHTCPVSATLPLQPPRFIQPDPLHLDHIRNFHRRLSQSLLKPVEPFHAGPAPLPALDLPCLSDIVSASSEGSDMTSFTQHDTSTSFSAFADTCFDTTSHMTKPPLYQQTVTKNLSPTDTERIHHLHREPIDDSLTLSGDLALECPEHNVSSVSFPSSSSVGPGSAIVTSRSAWPLRPSPDPVSPISFSSPTSSNQVLPFRSSHRARNQSLLLEHSSPSFWESSYSSEFNDLDLSRIESLHLSLTHSSVTNTPEIGSRQSSEIATHAEPDSSLEVDVHTHPILTALSLPGSADTSVDTSVDPLASPRWTLSLLPASPSASQTETPPVTASSLPSLPVICSEQEEVLLAFPSPSISISPFTCALPSPALDNPDVGDSSTVEYANALLSSVWGRDATIHPDCDRHDDGIVVLDVSPTTFQDDHAQNTPVHTQAARRYGIMHRIKKFSGTMRKLLIKNRDPKTKKLHSEVGRLRRHSHTASVPVIIPDVLDIQNSSGAQQLHALPENSSLVSVDDCSHMSRPLPLPPGLTPPPIKMIQPTLTPQTYSTMPSYRHNRTSHDQSLTSPPTIRIPSSSSSHRYPPTHLPMGISATNNPMTSHPHALEIQARPKTLAEIKSKRRLSLSTLSNVTRATTPPNSSLIAIARPRTRPQSTIIFTSRQAYSDSTDSRDTVNHGRNLPNTVAPTSHMPTPAGNNSLRLQVPPSTSRSSFHGQSQASPTNISDLSSTSSQCPTPVVKKNRRFSLSILSGLVNNHGSGGTLS